MDAISEGLRKLILAGIGAVAATKEKSEVILDELVKKGELTVEQGKVLNEELKQALRDYEANPDDVYTLDEVRAELGLD